MELRVCTGIVPITRVCHGSSAARPRCSRLWGRVKVVIAHARVNFIIVDSVFITSNSHLWIWRWALVPCLVTFNAGITPVISASLQVATRHTPTALLFLKQLLRHPRNRFRTFVRTQSSSFFSVDWTRCLELDTESIIHMTILPVFSHITTDTELLIQWYRPNTQYPRCNDTIPFLLPFSCRSGLFPTVL